MNNVERVLKYLTGTKMVIQHERVEKVTNMLGTLLIKKEVEEFMAEADLVCYMFKYLSIFCDKRVHFGPSGVRALPLAAGINVGGHHKWHYFLSLSLLFLPAHC